MVAARSSDCSPLAAAVIPYPCCSDIYPYMSGSAGMAKPRLAYRWRPNSLVSDRANTQKVTSPGLRSSTPCFTSDNLATRRQDGRHVNQILLLDIRIAQCELECRESIAMDAYALGQEHACGAREHQSPPFLWTRRIAVAMRRSQDALLQGRRSAGNQNAKSPGRREARGWRRLQRFDCGPANAGIGAPPPSIGRSASAQITFNAVPPEQAHRSAATR